MGYGSAAELDRLVRTADKRTVVVDERVPTRLFPGEEVISLRGGEAVKTPAKLIKLWEAFARRKLGRDSFVVAVGGGTILDLVAFAASTYLRGLRLVLVPTTLLAQADASIGGKTGVNLKQAKNLVGTFYPARYVVIDPSLLQTLPDIHFRAGLAEIVKWGIIRDRGLFELLEARAPISQESDPALLEEIIFRSARVKASIVQRDELETGIRAILNYGHTVGHGLEKGSGYRLPHGLAVAIGMNVEARIARHLGLCSPELVERQRRLLERLRLPTEIPKGISLKTVFEAMTHDKKRKGGTLRFVLPVRVGAVRFPVPVSPDVIRQACLRPGRDDRSVSLVGIPQDAPGT